MELTMVARSADWGKHPKRGAYSHAWRLSDIEGLDLESTREAIGDAIVEAFHRRAREWGSAATWLPATSEVIAPTDDPVIEAFPDSYFAEKHPLATLLDQWREEATEEILNRIAAGDYEDLVIYSE